MDGQITLKTKGAFIMPTPEEFQTFSKDIIDKFSSLEKKVGEFHTDMAIIKYRIESGEKEHQTKVTNWVILLGGAFVLLDGVVQHFWK